MASFVGANGTNAGRESDSSERRRRVGRVDSLDPEGRPPRASARLAARRCSHPPQLDALPRASWRAERPCSRGGAPSEAASLNEKGESAASVRRPRGRNGTNRNGRRGEEGGRGLVKNEEASSEARTDLAPSVSSSALPSTLQLRHFPSLGVAPLPERPIREKRRERTHWPRIASRSPVEFLWLSRERRPDAPVYSAPSFSGRGTSRGEYGGVASDPPKLPEEFRPDAFPRKDETRIGEAAQKRAGRKNRRSEEASRCPLRLANAPGRSYEDGAARTKKSAAWEEGWGERSARGAKVNPRIPPAAGRGSREGQWGEGEK
ncbi:hypothetical protein KM043_007306 [Ampulex compressa]|nr:hypothetical protein KM043_007306 [Ampulex compressa]